MRAGGTAFYGFWGALALALTSFPYLYGWLRTPPGHVYSGFTTNLDDCLVYLSWMDQAARGEFFQRNLYSVEEQRPLLFNLWFLLLGNIVRLTRLPPEIVFHLARVLGGIGLLASGRALIAEALRDERAQRLAFGFLCFGAGVGWLFGGYDPARGFTLQPIDLFQPEAITFLSLYYSPLFAPATALMVVFATSLLRAERSGKWRDIGPAALAGALLGNFHPYDVIPLFAMALVWRAFTWRDGTGWLRLIVVGLASLPSTAWTIVASRLDPLFRARAFDNQPTLTPALWWVLLGYGLAFGLALVAIARRDRSAFSSPTAWRLLACWALVQIAIAYVPVPFQRKFLMGAHVPLCLLAGAAGSWLCGKLPGDYPRIAAVGLVVISAPSNLLFLLTDIGRLDGNAGSTAHRPYLTKAEDEALSWLRQHTRPGDAVLVSHDPDSVKRFPGQFLPHLAGYVAGRAGRIVYDGHWSETIGYERKLSRTLRFFDQRTSDADREALLRENGIDYVLLVNALTGFTDAGEVFQPAGWPGAGLPGFLVVAYANPEITLFAVSPESP